MAVNIVYAGVLLRLSLMAVPFEVPVLSRADWLAHGLAYGIQTALLFALVKEITALATKPGEICGLALAAVGTFAFGAAMEVLQLLQPTRCFQVMDLVANGVGVVVAVTILSLFPAVLRARSEEIPS